MYTQADIERMLSSIVLSGTSQKRIPELARLLSEAANNELAADVLQARITSDPGLESLLKAFILGQKEQGKTDGADRLHIGHLSLSIGPRSVALGGSNYGIIATGDITFAFPPKPIDIEAAKKHFAELPLDILPFPADELPPHSRMQFET